MLLSVQRSKIFDEFTPEEQEYWFAIKEKAVSHHVDSLYYSVYIKDDKRLIEDPRFIGYADENGKEKEVGLLGDLCALKEKKRVNLSESVSFHELQVAPLGGFAPYTYWLQCPERYDIFIAHNISNDITNRIHVQLRTHMLVLDGLYDSIEEALEKVRDILTAYNLEIERVEENRIDYAFHTNCIQNPLYVLGTESLNEHLLCCFDRGLDGFKVPHRVDEDLSIDYCSLGSKKSNYIFFRAYEKSKEVIQMNYKAFFFQKWRERGLISRYDQYVYEQAYILGSYSTGVLVGRVKWYLEHGKNEERKQKLADLLKKYYENSSNNTALEKEIKGILPPTTLVFNVEFETHRKFYTYYNKFIDSYSIKLADAASEEAKRLYKVLGMRREFLDKLLTRYVSFVDDRRSEEPEELDWWRRIRTCKIKDVYDEAVLEMWRDYSRRIDLNRQKTRSMGSIANLSMLYTGSDDGSDFGEDIINALTFLNDNDKVDFDALRGVTVSGYKEVKKRKARQLMPILKKMRDIKCKDISMKKYREDLETGYTPNVYVPDRADNKSYKDYARDKNDAWRCIRCSSVKYGDNELYKMLHNTFVYPYYEGICKRCQRIFGKRKK